jgi:hypothetical protein
MPLMRTSTTAAAKKPAVTADPAFIAGAYVIVVLGAALGISLWYVLDPEPFTAGAGFSVFAPLYILAQSIERLLEPFATYMGSAKADGKMTRKPDAKQKVYEALVAGDAGTAATWQRIVDRIRRNTTVITWATASFIGMAVCGALGILFLDAIGFEGTPAPVDIVISGLAVGSGTKPLHDLISSLQKAREEREDPPERQAA